MMNKLIDKSDVLSNISFVISLICLIVNIIILFQIISISKCNGAEFKLEYDQHFSTSSGVVNTKTVYDTLSVIQDETVDRVRFKLIGSGILAFPINVAGHELYGHGYPLRVYDIPRKYNIWPPQVSHLKSKDLIINSQVILGGIKFDREYEDSFVKDGIVENFNYRNSINIFFSELSYVTTMWFSEETDIDNYITNINKMNSNTDIDDYLENSIYLSLINPSFLLSSYILGKTLWTDQDRKYVLDYLPTISFNMYSTAVTRELGLSINVTSLIYGYDFIDRMINKCQYMRLTYEFGQDVYNEKVNGFSFEYTTIPICNNISTDIKIHHVENCVSDTLVTLNFEHLYFRWKHRLENFDELEPTDKFSVGYRF